MRVLQGKTWKVGASLATLFIASSAGFTTAQAGGFAVREQSAYYQGMSFAGAAAGNELSSMFWNSAAAASAPGMNSESHVSLIVGDSEITASSPDLGFPLESGDISDPAVVPASYANYQVSDRLFLGLAINSPAGLTTKPDNTDWIGSFLAVKSKVFTVNANPTVAYKLTDTLTIGAGIQIQYTDFKFSRNVGQPFLGTIEADDYGVGFTAGLIWQPAASTQIGLGYRSGISTKLEGEATVPIDLGAGVVPVTIDAEANEFDSPDLVTLSVRQGLTDQLTLYGSVEWQNWSNLKNLNFSSNGTPISGFDLNWDDGWFFALGVEYNYSQDWTLRGGVAYELSPIDETRSVFLPDNDRLWLSVGATHRLTENITIDLAYTHVFVEDAPINRPLPPELGGVNLIAEAETNVDIISASFKYKWGYTEPVLEPYK